MRWNFRLSRILDIINDESGMMNGELKAARNGHNSSFIIRHSSLLFMLALALSLALATGPALAIESQPGASDANIHSDKVVDAMEHWTAARWGKDCFVWVVCYANDVVDPWVENEALRNNMSDSDKEAYRAQFVSDLRLDNSETFLVNIFAFGATPVDLNPVPDNLTLLSSNGSRLRPTRYDSRFDSPISGLVQGLVFFPKQESKTFALSIRGLGMSGDTERIFAFPSSNSAQYYEPATGEPEYTPVSEPEPEVIVVTLPKKERETKKSSKSGVKVITQQDGSEISPPQVPVTPREIPPLFADENTKPESSDMAAFVKSVRDRNTSAGDSDNSNVQTGTANQDNNYVSRETTLRQFVSLWVQDKGEVSADTSSQMYDMLCSASRKVISRENFARELSRASDLRAAMRESYTLEWVGEERARVICYQKFLMFRSLLTRTLGVTRENSSWKVVW